MILINFIRTVSVCVRYTNFRRILMKFRVDRSTKSQRKKYKRRKTKSARKYVSVIKSFNFLLKFVSDSQISLFFEGLYLLNKLSFFCMILTNYHEIVQMGLRIIHYCFVLLQML